MINPKLLEALSKKDSIRLMVSMIDVISAQYDMLEGEGSDKAIADAYFMYCHKLGQLYLEYKIDPPRSRAEEVGKMLKKAIDYKTNVEGKGSDLDEGTQR